MSCLKLYAPQDEDLDDVPQLAVFDPEAPTDDEPQILSWRIRAGHAKRHSLVELITRSKLLHRHRCCRDCGRPTVQPLEHDDAMLGKNRLPIPGTSTLLGFQCTSCQSEWSV